MYRMEESSAFLREKTYTAARSTIQEYAALFNGLSRKIMYLADRVKGLRACLVVRSPHSKYSASRINNGIIVHQREKTSSQASRKRWTIGSLLE